MSDLYCWSSRRTSGVSRADVAVYGSAFEYEAPLRLAEPTTIPVRRRAYSRLVINTPACTTASGTLNSPHVPLNRIAPRFGSIVGYRLRWVAYRYSNAHDEEFRRYTSPVRLYP